MFLKLKYHSSTAWKVQIRVQLTTRSPGETHNDSLLWAQRMLDMQRMSRPSEHVTAK